MLCSAVDLVGAAWTDAWAPDPVRSVCDWADENVRLPDASAEAGRFRSSRTPYVAEILDSLSPHSPVQRVVWIAGAQVGKTQTGLNWLAACMHMWPALALVVEPTLDVSKKLSQQKLGPLIQNTTVLADLQRGPDTVLKKEFEGGGQINLVGANSPSSLRSASARYLYFDELDAVKADLEDEGSPLLIAEERTNSFGSKAKIFLTSTPKVKGASAIEAEYEKSDKRRYFVPCPHCGAEQTIEWVNIAYDDDDASTARLICIHCKEAIYERHKTFMLENGRWRATAASKNGSRGYHLSGLYSPAGWLSWAGAVQKFLNAKDDPSSLKTFVNLTLGETWEERGDGVDPDSLKARLEPAEQGKVPDAARILTAAVDVQGDRLELKVKAWGVREESWLVYYEQLDGDPAQDEVWHQLDDRLGTSFLRADGNSMRIDTTLIDSGGHHTDAVYRFCKVRGHRRIWPLKGVQQAGRPVVSNPTRTNKFRVPLYSIGVDAAKDTVVARLQKLTPGPGFIHLPDWVDDEYLAQLTAEKAIRRKVRFRTVREWVPTRKRNEAFDLEVYCLAALYTRGPMFLDKLLERRRALPADSEREAGMSAGSLMPRQDKQHPVVESAEAVARQPAANEPSRPKWGTGAVKARWGSRRAA